MTGRKKEKNVEKREIRQKRWKDKNRKERWRDRKEARKKTKKRAREGKERGKTGKEKRVTVEAGQPPGGPSPGPLGAAAGTRSARVCTPSAHPFSLVAAPPCQSPGRREGQPACVITAGPAPSSAWPPYLCGPLLPPLSAETARFLPCHPPSPVSGRRADTLPGKGSTRGSAPCGPCPLWTDCDPLTWVICPPPPSPWNLPPAPHHPISILDQEGPETRGVHPRRSLSIGHSGIAPVFSKMIIIPEGDEATRDPTLSWGWGTVTFVSRSRNLGTKTPALWQAGSRHRGLHAGRLQSTGNHPLPQSWGPHV